ncbi:hypothetical protein [Vibrio owensii]|uniref:hypothetical protein n=1 Tax=Vibrio owensii TaxID=696485 RepID=UPI003CC5EF7A
MKFLKASFIKAIVVGILGVLTTPLAALSSESSPLTTEIISDRTTFTVHQAFDVKARPVKVIPPGFVFKVEMEWKGAYRSSTGFALNCGNEVALITVAHFAPNSFIQRARAYKGSDYQSQGAGEGEVISVYIKDPTDNNKSVPVTKVSLHPTEDIARLYLNENPLAKRVQQKANLYPFELNWKASRCIVNKSSENCTPDFKQFKEVHSFGFGYEFGIEKHFDNTIIPLTGKIVSMTPHIADDKSQKYIIEYSKLAQIGMSGTPLTDSTGHYIEGMIVEALQTEREYQNVVFALPANVIASMCNTDHGVR